MARKSKTTRTNKNTHDMVYLQRAVEEAMDRAFLRHVDEGAPVPDELTVHRWRARAIRDIDLMCDALGLNDPPAA